MNVANQLKKIELASAINDIVETFLPRFTKDKVLIVNIRFHIDNFKTNETVNRNLSILYYRPQNYMFVGTYLENKDLTIIGNLKTMFFPNKVQQELAKHSYHDSCWRSGTETIINKVAQSIYDKLKDADDEYHVYTAFAINPFEIVSAKIDIREKTATYIPIEVEIPLKK